MRRYFSPGAGAICILLSLFCMAHGCFEDERIALLDIRVSATAGAAGMPVSWSRSDDCCSWEGVVCSSNSTGRISHLYLSSLGGLQDTNQCRGNLNPAAFSAFCELQFLDFSTNYCTFRSWDGLVGLTKLQYLDLGENCLNGSIPASLGKLVSLEVLHLQSSGVGGALPASAFENLNNLRELDLSCNRLNGSIPASLFAITHLEHLNLAQNLFEGNIPVTSSSNLSSSFKTLNFFMNSLSGKFSFFWLRNLIKLERIDLSRNADLAVEVNFPRWTPPFQLKELILAGCDLDKSILRAPHFLSTQNQLEVLDFSNNNLTGNMPNWLFIEQSTLVYLNLGNNSLTGSLDTTYYPQMNIQAISLSMNRISGHLPANISSVFPNISFLDLSSNIIAGEIPSTMCNISSMEYLDLSNNNLSGKMPTCMFTDYPILKTLKVSNNKLGGPILGGKNHLLIKWELYLDGNKFNGTLPRYLTTEFEYYGTLDFHDNNLSGNLDFSSWNLSHLCTLNLAGNSLTGEIHPSICGLKRIMLLDLSNNNLSGAIPNCSTAIAFNFLSVSGNSLSGVIPPYSFFNSSTVLSLDLSQNQFTGNIEWVRHLCSIKYLSLGSNKFEGQIPRSLCQHQSLRIIDLSNNSLSGSLPPCIGNLPFEQNLYDVPYPKPSLICGRGRYQIFNYVHCYEQRGFSFRTKWNIYMYKSKFINWMSGIDFSANMLSGEIPWEFGNLSYIKALNLSYNSFAGPVPVLFGNMRAIESLDLSHNNLSGVIPWQLTRLSSLAVFSVAYNNLSGCIPNSGQFGSFDMDSYQGNNNLYQASKQRGCNSILETTGSWPPEDSDGSALDTTLCAVATASYVMAFLTTVACVLYQRRCIPNPGQPAHSAWTATKPTTPSQDNTVTEGNSQ